MGTLREHGPSKSLECGKIGMIFASFAKFEGYFSYLRQWVISTSIGAAPVSGADDRSCPPIWTAPVIGAAPVSGADDRRLYREIRIAPIGAAPVSGADD